MQRGTIYLEDMTIGLSRSFTKIISESDIQAFAEMSGDHNPLHLDAEYAAKTRFGTRIAHGMLSASLLSAIIGEQLPGYGAIYMGQSLNFRAPVMIGDEVTATCTVKDINTTKARVQLACTCMVRDKVVIDGEATVLAPRRASAT